MKRKVYLTGDLGRRFGSNFSVDVNTVRDALKCIDINRPGFKQYFLECCEEGINFQIKVEDKEIEEKGLLLSLKKGDIYISPVPAGSKSGGAKLLAAVAITALFIVNPTFGFRVALRTAGGLTAGGQIVAAIGINLALTGIQQLLVPDPSTDADEPTNYLFNGAAQNIIEGDPVPVLYGELRVPGKPISFEIVNRTFKRNNVSVDEHNNLILAGI